jgi:hypothetical protein
VRENLHPDLQAKFFTYCRSRLSGRRSSRSAEVRAAAAAVLLWHRQLTWQESRTVLAWKYSAWLRAWVPGFLQPEHIGIPSYQTIIHDLLRDEANDPALVAAELLVTHRLDVPRPIKTINPAAQQAMRSVGKIGRVQIGSCPIQTMMVRTLGPSVRPITWTAIFGEPIYRQVIPRVSVWASYATTDSTAWVVLTDTINDILLDALHRHDASLGRYNLGKLGSAMQATSRLALTYPKLYAVVARIHSLRLRADLAHPVTRSTNAPTRRIPFREMGRLLKPLTAGYLELWGRW